MLNKPLFPDFPFLTLLTHPNSHKVEYFTKYVLHYINIFKQKGLNNLMEDTEQIIHIDVHEDKKVYKAFDKKKVKYEIKALPVGDIVFNNLCIERKEVSDFYGSVLSQRIYKQALNMTKNYKYNYIIIVGDYKAMYYNKYMRFNNHLFLGAIVSLFLRYGVRVIQCKNNNELVFLTENLIKKLEDNTDQVNAVRIQYNSEEDVKLNILASIPGISIKRASQILDDFDVNIAFTPKHDKQAISELTGFGKKICEEIEKYEL